MSNKIYRRCIGAHGQGQCRHPAEEHSEYCNFHAGPTDYRKELKPYYTTVYQLQDYCPIQTLKGTVATVRKLVDERLRIEDTQQYTDLQHLLGVIADLVKSTTYVERKLGELTPRSEVESFLSKAGLSPDIILELLPPSQMDLSSEIALSLGLLDRRTRTLTSPTDWILATPAIVQGVTTLNKLVRASIYAGRQSGELLDRDDLVKVADKLLQKMQQREEIAQLSNSLEEYIE